MSAYPYGPREPLPSDPRPNFRSTASLVLIVYCVGWGLVISGSVLAGLLDVISQSRAAGASPIDVLSQPIPFVAMALLGTGMLCFLASLIFFAVLLHAMWGVVQDGAASLSPGAAVALTVIPLVNLVGMFFGFSALAKEINRVGGRMNQGRPLVSEGLALASCICYVGGAVGGCVPLIGCMFSIAGLVGVVLRYVSLFSMARACEWIVLSGGPVAATPFDRFGLPPVDRPNTFDPPGVG